MAADLDSLLNRLIEEEVDFVLIGGFAARSEGNSYEFLNVAPPQKDESSSRKVLRTRNREIQRIRDPVDDVEEGADRARPSGGNN